MCDVALYDLHHSTNIQRTKSKRRIWTGQVTNKGQKRNANTFLEENPEGKRLLEDLMQMGGVY